MAKTRTIARYFRIAFLLGIALLALVVTPGSLRAASAQDVTFTLTEFSISPATITVTAGQPIHFTITNAGKFPHNVTFMKGDDMQTLVDKPLTAGQSTTVDFTFPSAGTWEMHCPVGNHAAQGMVGQVLVLADATNLPVTGQADNALPIAVALLGLTFLSGGLVLARRKVTAK